MWPNRRLILFLVFLGVSGLFSPGQGMTARAEEATPKNETTALAVPESEPPSAVRSDPPMDPPASEPKPKLMPLPRFFDVWQKERERLADHGQTFSFDYTGEYVHILQNKDQKHTDVYMDNLNLKLSVDLAKARLARNGTFYLSILGNSGGNVTGDHLDNSGIGRVGDLQTLSNIETNETVRLYEFWLEKPVGRWSLLAGLRDLNAENYCSQYGALFANSSFGIGPDISKNAPVSIFNVTAPCIRAKYQFSRTFALQGSIYAGNPGTAEENKRGLRIRVNRDDGYFRIIEAQITDPLAIKQHPGLLRLGNWNHSGKFDDLMNVDGAGDPVRRQQNWGSYFLLDQKLLNRRNSPDEGLGFFIHGGWGMPNDRSLVDRYLGYGLALTGPFHGRPKDVLGIAHASARTSRALHDFNIGTGQNALETEDVLEIDYRYQFNDWLTIKPGLQIIDRVGGDTNRERSTVLGIRFNTLF